MKYFVDCYCGERIGVSPAQAGRAVTCCCGRPVAIPVLAALRRKADEEANPEIYVRCLHGEKAVGGEVCARCGDRPVESMRCFVECTKLVVATRQVWVTWLIRDRVRESVTMAPAPGSEPKVLDFELSLCAACQGVELQEDSIRQLLRRYPLFARLFEKYIRTRIWTAGIVKRPSADERIDAFGEFCRVCADSGIEAATKTLPSGWDWMSLARACRLSADRAELLGDRVSAARLRAAAERLASDVQYRTYLELPYHLD